MYGVISKKRYKKKLEELIYAYDDPGYSGAQMFFASSMIFYLDLEPLEKLTLFALTKSTQWSKTGRVTYRDLADVVGCSEERIVEAMHKINELLESGEIYRSVTLH